MSTATTAPAARPLPDTAATRAHFHHLNELLAEVGASRRPDRAQAAYLMAVVSVLTKFTGTRGLLVYARDLCEDGRNISGPVLSRIRSMCVHYAEVRNEEKAIALAEDEVPL